jgi:hypothetical protein
VAPAAEEGEDVVLEYGSQSGRRVEVAAWATGAVTSQHLAQ